MLQLFKKPDKVCGFLVIEPIRLSDTNMLDFLMVPKGKFLVTKFEFGGSFGMSLEGDFHEVEVTPNLELLFTVAVMSQKSTKFYLVLVVKQYRLIE
jgi:hypothetical protein